MIKEIQFSLSEILVPVLTAIIAVLGYLFKQQKDRIANIENQLSDKKYHVYHEAITIIFDIIKTSKGIKESSENDLVIKLIDIRKDFYIYAPDNIIRKFNEWQQYVEKGPEDLNHILVYMDMIVLIRKDMGHKNTRIGAKEILRSIFVNKDEFNTFMNTLG